MLGGFTSRLLGGQLTTSSESKEVRFVPLAQLETLRIHPSMRLADAPRTLSLVEFACATVEPGSTIRTDGARMLRRLGERGYTHEYATGYNSLDKASELPGVHLVASLLKRWLAGTLPYRASDKHLAYYVDEYAFRFNRRGSAAPARADQRVVGVDCAQAEMQNTRPSA